MFDCLVPLSTSNDGSLQHLRVIFGSGLPNECASMIDLQVNFGNNHWPLASLREIFNVSIDAPVDLSVEFGESLP